MAKLIISPCLFLKDGALRNLGELENTIDFIDRFLDVEWDIIDLSLLNEDNWTYISTNKPQLYNYFFNNIAKLLRKIGKRGVRYIVPSKNISYKINEPYYIADNNEVTYIAKYIHDTSDKIIMFVGSDNYIIPDVLNINVDDDSYEIAVVKDPWLDKSGNFNKYIVPQHCNKYFTNAILCIKLDEEMKRKSIKSSKNQTLYKDYGKVIAYRNGYTDYIVKDPYDENTDYYKTKKCSISVDVLHGHFEVFQKGGKELWIHQYNYSGEEIPYSNEKTLEEMQNNHRVHKRRH